MFRSLILIKFHSTSFILLDNGDGSGDGNGIGGGVGGARDSVNK